MATYFQSSSTCEQGRGQNNKCEMTEEFVSSDKMKSEEFILFYFFNKNRWEEEINES